MLGLGRAMGETIAVALVIGSSHKITSHLFRSGRLDGVGDRAQLPGGDRVCTTSALIGLGVVLFAITIVVNVVARAIANRSVLDAGTAR